MSVALVVGWLAIVVLVAVLALPVSAWLFGEWPDRGASMAPAVGLAVLTLVGFWTGHVAMGLLPVVAGVAVLVVASALAMRAGVDVPARGALAPLVVFLGAFALYLLMRAAEPALIPAGGEKFLDVGLIYAVRRAGALPPQDVWFAGEPLRYYYGGPLLAGLLSTVTSTVPHVAYNLMGPTIFGAFVAAVYGLTGAIASARGTGHRIAGVLGAFFVSFAGTLATPARGLSTFLPREFVAEHGRFLYGAIRMDYDDAVDAARFLDGGGEYSYWLARYVIPDTPNVFPFWTYVNGDLRPHMYAGPFFVLAIALAFAYYRTPAEARSRRLAIVLGAFPAVAGLLGVVNTFDLPAAVGVVWLTALFARAGPGSLLPSAVREHVPRPTRLADRGVLATTDPDPLDSDPALASRVVAEGWRVLAAALLAAVVALVAAIWAAPVLLANTPDNRGIALLGPTSNLGGLLLVFGAFLVAFGLWLGPRAIEAWPRRRVAALTAGLIAFLGLTTLVGYPAVGLFAPQVVGGWWLLRTGRARSFAVVLVVAGAGLVLVPEFGYADVWPYDPNAPRWNTIYKLTLQVWTLWGVAAGVALGAVFARAREVVASGFGAVRSRPVPIAGAALAALLIVLAATFPVIGIASKAPHATGPDGDLALSLDGTDRATEFHPDVMAATGWLREETTGQPTMVSRPAGRTVYTWEAGANTASTFSGVPTVVGWEHVAGYHGVEPFEQRLADVERFYTGNPSEDRTFVRQYDVQYVFVGPAERDAYESRDFAVEFPWIGEAYRNGSVTIYEVDRQALDETDASPAVQE